MRHPPEAKTLIRRTRAVIALVALSSGGLIGGPPGYAAAAEPAVGSTTRFARIPAPGFAEGSVLAGDTLFVGTEYGLRGNAGGPPSKIFLFDRRSGALEGSIVVAGEDLGRNHAVIGMAVDGVGRLYVGAEGTGVLRFRQERGRWLQETYAVLPDLRPCRGDPAPCSPTRDDRVTLPNDLAFDDAGNLYVADSWQATVWKVAPGTRTVTAWFQDERFDHVYGANGVRLGPDGRHVFLAVTGPDALGADEAGGPPAIYTLPLTDHPARADLRLFHAFQSPESPDGIGFGASGRLYVMSVGTSTVHVLEPDGGESARFPDPVANATSADPYDNNSSFVFNDARGTILVVNHAVFDGDAFPDRHLVLEAYVGDTGLPLARPVMP